MVKGPVREGVRQRARSGEIHIEDQIGEIEGQIRGVKREHTGSVQGADLKAHRRRDNGREIPNGRPAPGVAFKRHDAGDGRPEIGGDVDFEVAGAGVVEGGDDDGLVDVFGGVVEDFPAAGGLDPGPGGGLPDVFELPVEGAELAVREARAPAVEGDLGAVEVRLEDLGRVAPGGEVGEGEGFVGDLGGVRVVSEGGLGEVGMKGGDSVSWDGRGDVNEREKALRDTIAARRRSFRPCPWSCWGNCWC